MEVVQLHTNGIELAVQTSFIPTEFFGTGFEFGGRVKSRSRGNPPQRPSPPAVTVTTPSPVTPFTAFRHALQCKRLTFPN